MARYPLGGPCEFAWRNECGTKAGRIALFVPSVLMQGARSPGLCIRLCAAPANLIVFSNLSCLR